MDWSLAQYGLALDLIGVLVIGGTQFAWTKSGLWRDASIMTIAPNNPDDSLQVRRQRTLRWVAVGGYAMLAVGFALQIAGA